MDSYFAPSERAEIAELQSELNHISASPLINGLMNMVSGLLAVLNEQRQILALNEKFLETLGVEDAFATFGLRLGEAIQCVHAYDDPEGCGTTRFCSSCGAAIAMVASLETDKPVERTCAVKIERNFKKSDLFFLVRSAPMTLNGSRFILLFLTDITRQQKWASLERVFFHDISNLLTAMVGKSDLMLGQLGPERDVLAYELNELTARMLREIEIQRQLTHSDIFSYRPLYRDIELRELIRELEVVFSNHPLAADMTIEYPPAIPEMTIHTDISLVLRILTNMVVNALEASHSGDSVKIKIEVINDAVTFCVWNRMAIHESMRDRIFQRNYTTKSGMGRGTGLYSMKLFGEDILGGRVDCTSTEKDGTEFRFTLGR